MIGRWVRLQNIISLFRAECAAKFHFGFFDVKPLPKLRRDYFALSDGDKFSMKQIANELKIAVFQGLASCRELYSLVILNIRRERLNKGDHGLSVFNSFEECGVFQGKAEIVAA